jgi:hypothetical protein
VRKIVSMSSIVVATAILMLGARVPVAEAAPTAAPATVTNTTTVPLTGTLADGTGSVQGDYVVSQLVERDGGLAAVGTFSGTVTDAAGAVRSGTQSLVIPVAASTSAPGGAPGVAAAAVDCPILHLDLAPLNLDLLGLVVDLDRVVLDIVATPGAGNLLGNLLCAVTGLLDGAGTITQIIGLINQILALLGGLGA